MMSHIHVATALVIVAVLGITEAQNRWFQPNFYRQPQFGRDQQRFPIYRQHFNRLQPSVDSLPVNGRFMGFNRPLFGQDFYAAIPTEPGVNNQDSKMNKAKIPRPTIQNQKRISKDNGFQPTSEENTDFQVKAIPAEPIDACSNVVCPGGTLCETHSSQCSKPLCRDYAVCAKIQAIDSCKYPMVVGSCSHKYDSYFYNSISGKCEPFVYSGCDGNNNRFTTIKQCQQVCVPSKQLCHLAKETGPCRAAKPRWFFDQNTQTCKRFVYGGCRGNSNNFETKVECLRMCSV